MTHVAKVTFFSGLVVLCAAIGAFVFVQLQISKAGEELEAKVQRIANQQAQEQTLRELEKLVADTEAERASLHEHVLSESDTIEFLAQMEQVGSSRGVELTTRSLDVVALENGLSALSINYGVVGSETAVQDMLRIFETIPYDSELVDVALTRGEVVELEVTLNVTLFDHATIR